MELVIIVWPIREYHDAFDERVRVFSYTGDPALWQPSDVTLRSNFNSLVCGLQISRRALRFTCLHYITSSVLLTHPPSSGGMYSLQYRLSSVELFLQASYQHRQYHMLTSHRHLGWQAHDSGASQPTAFPLRGSGGVRVQPTAAQDCLDLRARGM